MDWGKENRYPIVAGSWVLSMGIALGIVGRSPHLSTQQKLVQARVYAQGLTIAVLIATAAFEVGDSNKGEGRWETVKIIDPNDPEHKHLIEKKVHHERYEGEDQWRGGLTTYHSGYQRNSGADGAYSDMIETEERKMKEREAAVKEQEKQEEAAHKSKHKDNEHHGKKKTHKDEKDGDDDKKDSEGKKKDVKGP